MCADVFRRLASKHWMPSLALASVVLLLMAPRNASARCPPACDSVVPYSVVNAAGVDGMRSSSPAGATLHFNGAKLDAASRANLASIVRQMDPAKGVLEIRVSPSGEPAVARLQASQARALEEELVKAGLPVGKVRVVRVEAAIPEQPAAPDGERR